VRRECDGSRTARHYLDGYLSPHQHEVPALGVGGCIDHANNASPDLRTKCELEILEFAWMGYEASIKAVD